MEISQLSEIAGTVSSYNIGTSMNPVGDKEAISVAILGKAIDSVNEMSMQMIQSLEKSVTPNLGNNIDMYI